MSCVEACTSARPDYTTAMWADGPKLADYLWPLVPKGPEWANVDRQLRAMRAHEWCVSFFTADKLCIRLGLHPSELPDRVWTTWEAMHPPTRDFASRSR
jgi:hypothetical protein